MRLARGGGSVMALNVAGMAQALLLQVVLARLLGHEGYGQFAYVMAWINILVYVALGMVPMTWWVLFRTRFGLRLRAVGENPGAVDTAGV